MAHLTSPEPRRTSAPPVVLSAFAAVALVLATLLAGASPLAAHEPSAAAFDQGRELLRPVSILAPRERPAVVNRLLTERLETVLPGLMEEADLDLWLVICREYAEDPVYFTLVPEPTHAARRTTMLLLQRVPASAREDDGEPGSGVRLLTVNRYPLGEPWEAAWQGGDLDAQWAGLAEVIEGLDPARIGVNVSEHWPVADGLTAGLRDRLEEALGPELSERLVSAEDLVIPWLETRTAAEAEVWSQAVAVARRVIAEAFSPAVITPGVTTTDQVAWWIYERFLELDLDPWFLPSVDYQRAGRPCGEDQPFCGGSGVIRQGDVLHTDVGICYLRLCTDTQEMAYVPRLGESGVPPELVRALAVGNRWQDLLAASFEDGRPGNEILARTIAANEAEGIVSSTYTHPLGHFGHAPGPTIGMWDNQGDTPVRGDWALRPMTGYAIEGNVKVPVEAVGGLEGWEGPVQISLEQSALWTGERIVYLAGRQTEWHVVE